MYLDEFDEPVNNRSKIFESTESSIQYCISTGLLSPKKTCCAIEATMLIRKSERHTNKRCFRCSLCGKRISLFENLPICSPAIELNKYFLCIYKWLELAFEKDVIRNLDIYKQYYYKIKQKIGEYLSSTVR
jgi:transposase-like protein